jgi:NAD(P)H-hydrate epimerase
LLKGSKSYMSLAEIKENIKYVDEEQVASLFPERPSDCHKGSFGYVAMIGGSLEYSGAIRLAAHANAAMHSGVCGLPAQADAAMRSGAGVATVAAPRSICPLILPQVMEATLYPLSDEAGEFVFNEEEFARLCRRYDCIAFGMGIGNSDETLKAVEYLLTHYDRKLILDADGLNAMARLDHEIIRESKAQLVLTPHAKEFSKLSGMSVAETKADPVSAAKYLADELDAVVLLKGSTTIVAGAETDDGREAAEAGRRIKVLATDRGCPGMATGGSGDVLSGILSALCANTDDLVLAAAAGAYINGAAGELAQSRRSDVTMTSGDTAECVAEVIEGIIERYR